MKIVANSFDEMINAIMGMSATVDCVDNGIGNYEYWGAKGVHHDYDFEIEGEDLEIEINFLDEEEELEYVVEEYAYEAQCALFEELNRGADEDFDYSDVVKLGYEINGNVVTLSWERA